MSNETVEHQKPEKPSFLAEAMMRRTSGGGRKRDIVAEVIDVDPEKGVIHVKDDQGEMRIEISSYTVDRMAKAGRSPRKEASHEGWIIDARMAEHARPGSKIILEGIVDYGKRGEEQTANYPVNWIRIAPMNDAKVRTALISSDGPKDGVFHIYEWARRGMGEQMTATYAKKLDAQMLVQAEQQREYQQTGKRANVDATFGFVVRVHQDGYVLAHSPILHWNQTDSRPFSGDELRQAVDYYRDAFPDTSVEVIPVRVYRPSSNITKDIQGTFPRARVLNGTRSSEEQGLPLPAYGKGTAVVEGVLLLSTGKLDPRTGERKGAENNWVNAVYASGKISHAMEAVLTADEKQLKVHKDLELVFPGAPEQKAQEESAPTQEKPQEKQQPDADDPFAFLETENEEDVENDMTMR